MSSEGGSIHTEPRPDPLQVDSNRYHDDRHHPPSTDTHWPETVLDDDSTKVARTAALGILDTGWEGHVPSQRGGDSEPDFMRKPPYFWNSLNCKFKQKHHLRCWCGNVQFEFHGDPADSKYCHCKQCQRLHGAPFQWAVIFPKTSVRMLSNKDDSLHFFSAHRGQSVHDVPCKVSCNACRSSLFDEGRNTVLAFPPAFEFPDSKIPASFRSTAHIFYSQRVLDVRDGIPKWSGHKNESERLPEHTTIEGV